MPKLNPQGNSQTRVLKFLMARSTQRANSLEIGISCGVRNVPHAVMKLRKDGYQIDSVILPEVMFQGSQYRKVAEYFLVGKDTGYVYKSRGWGSDRKKGEVVRRGPKHRAPLGHNVGKLDLTKKGFLV